MAGEAVGPVMAVAREAADARRRSPTWSGLAVKCQSAEELGQKLRRRYQRQQQRQGQTPPGPQPRRRAELAEPLDRLLVQD